MQYTLIFLLILIQNAIGFILAVHVYKWQVVNTEAYDKRLRGQTTPLQVSFNFKIYVFDIQSSTWNTQLKHL